MRMKKKEYSPVVAMVAEEIRLARLSRELAEVVDDLARLAAQDAAYYAGLAEEPGTHPTWTGWEYASVLDMRERAAELAALLQG
jgi:hypothetical protein